MTDQLWPDERIDANAKMARWEMGGAISLVEPDKTILAIKKVATFVRNDLQQRIAELEAENVRLRAQIDEQWTPLESEFGALANGYEHKMCRRRLEYRVLPDGE